MKCRRFVFPAICAAVSAVVFVGVNLLIVVGTVTPPYVEGLLLLVPAAVFSALAVVAYRRKSSAIAVNAITAVLIPIFAVLSVMLLLCVGFSEATEPCDDPGYYTRAYNACGDNPSVAHAFPERIPDDARDVRFHYHGAFLQGGGELSLAYSVDPEDLSAVEQRLRKSALWCGKSTDFSDWDDRPSYFRGESFWGDYRIPDDATVYLVDYRNPYGEDEDGHSWWNHGSFVVAAVSVGSGKAVFRYCYW